MKTGTKCRLIGIGMLIMLALYVAATVVLHFAGIDTRIVHSGVDVGKPSPDGQFRLVELVRPHGTVSALFGHSARGRWKAAGDAVHDGRLLVLQPVHKGILLD